MKEETEEEDGMGSRNKADGEEKSWTFSQNGPGEQAVQVSPKKQEAWGIFQRRRLRVYLTFRSDEKLHSEDVGEFKN